MRDVFLKQPHLLTFPHNSIIIIRTNVYKFVMWGRFYERGIE